MLKTRNKPYTTTLAVIKKKRTEFGISNTNQNIIMKLKNKVWKVLSIIIGFPILYILFGKTSIAIELFANKNLDYYIPF
ncbi:hypothetical protein AST99_02080 [Formosa algae]|nr:hypothetical protein AST99_02080 [Formosa algae]